MSKERIVVLDFGSQYAHLIAKRLRLLGYYTEVASPTSKTHELAGAKGIILSGGPASLNDPDAPDFNDKILVCPQLMDIPTLGICYGHYLIAKKFGGEVETAPVGEYGKATLTLDEMAKVNCPLFDGINEGTTQVWMSHRDQVTQPGDGFITVGHTEDCEHAALYKPDDLRPFFSIQFHPEVADTPCGMQILKNFAHKICKMERNWDSSTALEEIKTRIRQEAGDKRVMLYLSGGVDSTVAFKLLNDTLGPDRVIGVHIDNGFMRKQESIKVAENYRKNGMRNFVVYNASDEFLEAVDGLIDPQEKRKAIGDHFVKVKDAAERIYNLRGCMLAQGTLYPDIIESGGTENSHVIKTHHNRSPKILELMEKGLILEPLKELYKDEVRRLGEELGLPETMVWRHPFPGPGLAINVLCSDGKIPDGYGQTVKEVRETMKQLEETSLWQQTGNRVVPRVSVLPARSTGVQGDQRTYGFPVCLDYGWADEDDLRHRLDYSDLEKRSIDLTNRISSVNRCVVEIYRRAVVCHDEYVPVSLCLQEGALNKERLDQTRDVDEIVMETLHRSGWYNKIFQHLTINLPYASKPHNCSIVLRPVVSEDVMTASFAHLPAPLLVDVIDGIREVCPYVDAVYYDVTNKPPATFGWE